MQLRSKIIRFLVFSLLVLSISSCGGGGSGSGSGSGGTSSGGTVTSGAQNVASGLASATLSDDGRYVAYEQGQDVYRLDRGTNSSVLVSRSTSGLSATNGVSFGPVISGDGRHVLFASKATNLVSGIASYPLDSSNQVIAQLYIRDTQAGTTSIVTADPTGTGVANAWTNYDKYAISRNGRYVVFSSRASNLVAGINHFVGDNVYVYDATTHITELISIATDGVSSGRNGSVSVTGVSNDSFFPAISDDGRYVAFESHAWNLVDGVTYTQDNSDTVSNVFLRDRAAMTTALLSISADGTQASDGNCSVQLFGTGRYMTSDGSAVVFSSRAMNLSMVVPFGANQTSVFLRERTAARPILVSTSIYSGGAEGNSSAATISSDGNYVAFQSDALDLVGGGIAYWTFGLGGPVARSIYRWTKNSGAVELVSLSVDGTTGADFDTQFPVLSDDGQFVTFSGSATVLTQTPSVPLTFDDRQDSVYRWSSTTKKVQLVSQQNGQSLGKASPNFSVSTSGNVVVFSRHLSGSYVMAY